MPYELEPVNPDAGPFRFGAFSFPVLLEACGYLFACAHNGSKWYANFPADPRMEGENPDGSDTPYPALLGGGFDVTEEEARIMAHMARNFVAIQKGLPEENRGNGMRSKSRFDRADLVTLIAEAMSGAKTGPWPEKVRDDFTEKISGFASWAPRSGGFHIRFSLSVSTQGDPLA